MGRGRLITDIDIIVPANQVSAAEQALNAAGWESSELDPYNESYYRRWSHEVPALVNHKRGTTLDLHHNILPPTAGPTINAALLFDRLREGNWWRAPVVSSVVGSSVDTALFFAIAFSASLSFIEPANDVSWANEVLPILGQGPLAPLWMSLALADWGVKLAIALIALVPFRVITTRIRPDAV